MGDCFQIRLSMELRYGPPQPHDDNVEVRAIYPEGCDAVEVDLESSDDGSRRRDTFLVMPSDIRNKEVASGGHVDPSTGAYHYLLSPADVLAERLKYVDVPVARVGARFDEYVLPISVLQRSSRIDKSRV